MEKKSNKQPARAFRFYLFFIFLILLTVGNEIAAQIAYVPVDSLKQFRSRGKLFQGKSFLSADFDGDSLADTCFAVKKDTSTNSKKGLYFAFGKGEKFLLAAGKERLITEIFSPGEQEKRSMDDLPALNWKALAVSALEKRLAMQEKQHQGLPDIQLLAAKKLSPFLHWFPKGSSVILLDLEDVYAVIGMTPSGKWLLFPLGV